MGSSGIGGVADSMMGEYICESCAPTHAMNNNPREHRCYRHGCQCGSCNDLPVTLYSPSGLQALQLLARRSGLIDIFKVFGFAFLMLASVVYSMMPIVMQSNFVWLGLLAGSMFFCIKISEGVNILGR